jgi:hypothetical protein
MLLGVEKRWKRLMRLAGGPKNLFGCLFQHVEKPSQITYIAINPMPPQPASKYLYGGIDDTERVESFASSGERYPCQ